MLMGIRRRLWAAALGLGALLAACGGGGDSDAQASALEAPPATAAALQGTSAEAGAAAAASTDGARQLARLSASLGGAGILPTARDGRASPASLGRLALLASRERALATQTLSCAQFLGTSGCTGSITVDTNASGSASVVPAGTYATLTFNALQGTLGGEPIALSGSLRIDYLTAFDVNATSFAGVRFQITLGGFAGTVSGVAFGPLDETALYEFDADSAIVVTIDGLRITGFDNLTVTDADNYNLPNVTLRRAHWAAPAGYVDVRFVSWGVVAGRPVVNSLVNLETPGSRIGVIVRASSASQVVYEVNCLINGVITNYTVTANYPAGGAAPTYTVVAS
jgi:hypothetical protein